MGRFFRRGCDATNEVGVCALHDFKRWSGGVCVLRPSSLGASGHSARPVLAMASLALHDMNCNCKLTFTMSGLLYVATGSRVA